MSLTIVSTTFRPVLTDVGNLVHAEEHGVVGTPLPIGFTACEDGISSISAKQQHNSSWLEALPAEGSRELAFQQSVLIFFWVPEIRVAGG